MPLSGNGMLITKMNVDASEEADFNDWYDKEHIAERVGIEGFTEARRYIAVDASIKYLNLYTVRSFDVLESPQYKAALQNQTARSIHHIERFRDSGRAVVKVLASLGQGRGASLFFISIRPLVENKEALKNSLVAPMTNLVEENNIISTHLVGSNPHLSKPLTETVPPPSASDWYILIEGTDADSVRQVGQAYIDDALNTSSEKLISQGLYQLMWDLSVAEL